MDDAGSKNFHTFSPVPSLNSVFVCTDDASKNGHAGANHTGASSLRLLHGNELARV